MAIRLFFHIYRRSEYLFMAAKKIVVAGEIYSANLADQIIFQCLKHIFLQLNPSLEIIPMDLSGRTAPESVSGRADLVHMASGYPPLRKTLMLKTVNSLYQFNKNYAKRFAAWESALQQADQLVIGGGALLVDNFYGFPMKLQGLSNAAHERQLPFYISACGVGKRWSVAAHRLFGNILKETVSITVPDSLSQQRLQTYLPEVQSHVTFNPSILVSDIYKKNTQPPYDPILIGLGIINLNEANFYQRREEMLSPQKWMQLWLNLLVALDHTHVAVEIFTSGSPADEQFSHELLLRAQKLGLSRVWLAVPSLDPQSFVSRVQTYQCVIAARLHPCIIANSFLIPSIGLDWNGNERAYYQDMQRPELCFDLFNYNANDVAETCVDLLSHPDQHEIELEKYRQKAFETVWRVLGTA
jgi:polysaccharide pyruvyl transferase WcaK-like protein